jgi:hypothetical protein
MLTALYSDKRWHFLFERSETFLDSGSVPEILPAWLSEADVNFYTEEFKRTGFRGALISAPPIDLWPRIVRRRSVPLYRGAIGVPMHAIHGGFLKIITTEIYG